MKWPLIRDRSDIEEPPLPEAGRLDHFAAGWRPWILLTLLCVALYLPGITTLPPIDRDEARFVQATRQMLETGDFLHIRFQNEARNKKPAGIYWLQAGLVAAFSDAKSNAIWPYRLVSLLGATIAVLLTFLFGGRIFDRRTGLAAAALMACSFNLVFEAHIATTDAVLLATAVAAQGSLAMIYLSRRRGEKVSVLYPMLFWTALGVSILVKGPVVPAISLLTIAAVTATDRKRAWLWRLYPWFGLPITAAIVMPWLYMIQQATNGAFLQDSVGHDLLAKILTAQEGHGAPPFYYLGLTPVTFWPGSLFLGFGAVWAWRTRGLPATRFLLAWLVPFWVILEFLPTKLPHYVMPLYPALALIVARALIAHTEEGFLLRPRWWLRAPAIVWSLLTLTLGWGLFALPLGMDAPEIAMVIGVAPAALAAATLWQLWISQRARISIGNLGSALILGLVVSVSGLGLILPTLDPLWVSRSASDLVAAEPDHDGAVAVVGDAEPSLVFLLGTDTALESPEAAAADLTSGKVKFALVEKRDDERFHAGLTHAGKAVMALGTASGLNYSNGHDMTLVLYRLGGSNT